MVQANQIRGLLAEYGIVSPQEFGQIAERLLQIREDGENGPPRLIRRLLERLGMSSKRWTNKLGTGIVVQALAIDATREAASWKTLPPSGRSLRVRSWRRWRIGRAISLAGHSVTRRGHRRQSQAGHEQQARECILVSPPKIAVTPATTAITATRATLIMGNFDQEEDFKDVH
ncbi:MAG: hypothetical protein ABJA60_08580 [Nitrosospira sp.]